MHRAFLNMRLGLSSFAFAWAVGVPGHPPAQPLTAIGLLHKAQALGVKLVQFGDNLPLVDLPDRERDECLAWAKSNGIELELGTRGLDESNLLAHLELARRLRAPFVRLVVDAKGHEPSPRDVVNRLRPLVARFADAGVRLGIENHDRFTARTLVEIIEQLGPAHVGVVLDTVNSLGALEGPETVVTTLAPYTLNLHVKDFVIERVSTQMGFSVTGCPVGHGRLDVPWVLDCLRTAGREVNAILELWPPPQPTIEATIALEQAWAEESVRYLRQLIPEP
jgi:3-oxoisoapionate decarboxylase